MIRFLGTTNRSCTLKECKQTKLATDTLIIMVTKSDISVFNRMAVIITLSDSEERKRQQLFGHLVMTNKDLLEDIQVASEKKTSRSKEITV